jgi:hypothetical protein
MSQEFGTTQSETTFAEGTDNAEDGPMAEGVLEAEGSPMAYANDQEDGNFKAQLTRNMNYPTSERVHKLPRERIRRYCCSCEENWGFPTWILFRV